MRHFSSGEPSPVTKPASGWPTIRTLLPYLLEYKGRVALALVFLVAAKLA